VRILLEAPDRPGTYRVRPVLVHAGRERRVALGSALISPSWRRTFRRERSSSTRRPPRSDPFDDRHRPPRRALGVPSLALLAVAVGNGAPRWPWPRGLVIVFASAWRWRRSWRLTRRPRRSALAEFSAVGALTVSIFLLGRLRVAWPFSAARRWNRLACWWSPRSPRQRCSADCSRCCSERDATVYMVSGIGLARQGSVVLRTWLPTSWDRR
jgi:hypothetical protein